MIYASPADNIYGPVSAICVVKARFEQSEPAAATVSRFSNNQQFSALDAWQLRGSQREVLDPARFADDGVVQLLEWSFG